MLIPSPPPCPDLPRPELEEAEAEAEAVATRQPKIVPKAELLRLRERYEELHG